MWVVAVVCLVVGIDNDGVFSPMANLVSLGMSRLHVCAGCRWKGLSSVDTGGTISSPLLLGLSSKERKLVGCVSNPIHLLMPSKKQHAVPLNRSAHANV